MQIVGIICMSAKPYHRGHHHLILSAAQNCDEVLVYVGCKDRENVKHETMQQIWDKQILVNLPYNVIVHFAKETTPVKCVLGILSSAENGDNSSDSFRVYSDPLEFQEYISDASLLKYYPKLMKNNRVTRVGIERVETGGISGSLMRDYLKSGERQKFINGLPDFMDGNSVWNVLSLGSRPLLIKVK